MTDNNDNYKYEEMSYSDFKEKKPEFPRIPRISRGPKIVVGPKPKKDEMYYNASGAPGIPKPHEPRADECLIC